MKLAVIAPKEHLLRYCRTDYHLALAHMMDDPEYVRFYRDTAKGFVILDNSVMELGAAVGSEFLEAAVQAFQPDELVLPDVPFDADTTFHNAEVYAPYFKMRYPNLKLMVVPQGEDVVCWMKDYYRYLRIPGIDTIGIPKHRKELRLGILEAIDRDRPFRWEHHLLGTWGNPGTELPQVRDRFDWVRGVDSKIPVRLGRLGIALHPERGMLFDGRYELPELPLSVEDDPFPIVSAYNIDVMRRWTGGLAESTARGLHVLPPPE